MCIRTISCTCICVYVPILRQLTVELRACRLVSGTSLVAVVSTAVASSYTYLSHGVVDTAAALIISCCAVLTAPIGANLTTTLNAQVRTAVNPNCNLLVIYKLPDTQRLNIGRPQNKSAWKR